jgi:hypothetical protein
MDVAANVQPLVSNDNPFPEAQFKTLKYRPEFPECFAVPGEERFEVSAGVIDSPRSPLRCQA